MTRIFAALALAAALHGTVHAQEATARRYVVIGCVSQENAKAGFLLTDTRRDPPSVYRLDGDVKQLSMLIGQTVEVSGPMTAGANKQPPTVKVAALTRIATTCVKGGK
jgi:hypothetical protein